MTGSNSVALAGVGLAALGLLINLYVERYRAKQAVVLKRFEVTFLQKRQAFADLFAAIRLLQTAALDHRSATDLNDAHGAVENTIYGLLPFLPKADHDWLIARSSEIEKHVHDVWSAAVPGVAATASTLAEVLKKAAAFRAHLYDKLFAERDERRKRRSRKQWLVIALALVAALGIGFAVGRLLI